MSQSKILGQRLIKLRETKKMTQVELAKGRKKKNIDTFFADKLLDLLANEKKNGITQEDVAKSIGVSRQALGKWANGSTVPDIIDLKKLAQYFNVSADYLIGLSDVASLDTDMQAVCDYIGLDDVSVGIVKNAATKEKNVLLMINNGKVKKIMETEGRIIWQV